MENPLLKLKKHFEIRKTIFEIEKPFLKLKNPFLKLKNPFLKLRKHLWNWIIHFQIKKSIFKSKNPFLKLKNPFLKLKRTFFEIDKNHFWIRKIIFEIERTIFEVQIIHFWNWKDHFQIRESLFGLKNHFQISWKGIQRPNSGTIHTSIIFKIQEYQAEPTEYIQKKLEQFHRLRELYGKSGKRCTCVSEDMTRDQYVIRSSHTTNFYNQFEFIINAII